MSDSWADLLMSDHEQTERVIDALEKVWSKEAPDPALVKKAVRYFSEVADA